MNTKEKTMMKVYRLLTKIPNGKVTTYGAIARKLGLNPRYVGKILSMNEHPELYPCYKVVRADGTIGGYTNGGKNDKHTSSIKAAKIAGDGVRILNGRVALNYIVNSF